MILEYNFWGFRFKKVIGYMHGLLEMHCSTWKLLCVPHRNYSIFDWWIVLSKTNNITKYFHNYISFTPYIKLQSLYKELYAICHPSNWFSLDWYSIDLVLVINVLYKPILFVKSHGNLLYRLRGRPKIT